jgi:hypothetical protein
MGPGFFPLLLSGLLGLIGLCILGRSFVDEGSGIGPITLRGTVLIIAALVICGLIIRRAGFLPSVATIALLGALASRRATIVQVLATTAIVTAACYLIFILGLGLPFPLFGTV